MKVTHTYAVLEVSKDTFDEIHAKLEAAGYQHAFNAIPGEPACIDMHGIALAIVEAPKEETRRTGCPSCKLMALEWAEDHTHLQQLCLGLNVPAEKVNGDNFGVPGISDLGDMLAELARTHGR